MLKRSPAMDPSRPLPLPPPNPAMPYREDCWSEGATSALIDAWGDRYIELNRGNLRQKDWQEVADTVNSRRGARHPPRADSQCKNRIDTLKKKYKAEKARIASGASGQSQWPFYPRLDTLIGASPVAGGGTPGKKPLSPSLPLALPIPSHRKPSPLPAARPVEPLRRHTPPTSLPTNGSYQRNYSAAAAAAAAAAYDSGSSASSSGDRLVRSPSPSPPPRTLIKWAKAEREDDEGEVDMVQQLAMGRRIKRAKVEREDDEGEVDMVQQLAMGRRIKRAKVEREDDEGEVDVVRQLAMAIDRFTEVYEKLERNRQKDMMELEMQRIEFLKGLEYQRLQVFVDLQVKLQEIKCSRRVDVGWNRLDEVGNQFKRARQAVQD